MGRARATVPKRAEVAARLYPPPLVSLVQWDESLDAMPHLP